MSHDIIMRTNNKRPYETHLTCEALLPDMIVNDFPPFMNYLECERIATTDIYVICDDDIIPARKDTVENLCYMLEAHPEIGILGLAYKSNMQKEDMVGWIRGEDIDRDIFDIDHVGGIFAIRRGILEDLGERPNRNAGIGDDMVLCRQFRKKGYKVAIYVGDWFIHIGEGKSTYW